MTIQTYPAPKSQVTSSFWRYTAVGAETTLTGIDNAGVQLAYFPGQEQVFLNGVMLVRGTDYTATNGTSITGLAALTASDYVQVTTYSNFTVTNIPVSAINGSILNLQLANSSFTIGSTLINLGDTKTTLTGLTLTTPTINNQIAGTGYSTSVPLTVKGATGQAVNLQEWNINGGTPVATLDASGNIIAGNIRGYGGIYSADEPNLISNNTSFNIIRTVNGAGLSGYKGASNNQIDLVLNAVSTAGTPSEKMRIQSDGRILFNTTAYATLNPGNFAYDFTNAGAWLKGAITTTGSYGGPISMLDGTNGWNIRLQDSGANIRFASGSTTTGLTDRFKIRNDNVIETYGTIYSARGAGATNVAFAADGTGMGASSYNYVINGSNETGANALVVFVNGSSRTADNGVNSVTIRNDIANLYLGRSGATTYIYSYTAASDRNLKENIVDYSGGIDIIKSLNPKQFNFIDNPRTQYGFIAQEVTNDKIVIEGKNGEPWGVDYNAVVSALTLAVQELTARIESLEDK